MLALSEAKRYYLYRHSADMRKGFDGLSGIVNEHMQANALSGDVFIFFNKRRNQVKLLMWSGDGFAIYHKRLEKGTYELPELSEGQPSVLLSDLQLRFILSGIELKSIKRRIRYSRPLQK
jgi:transposase